MGLQKVLQMNPKQKEIIQNLIKYNFKAIEIMRFSLKTNYIFKCFDFF